MTREEEIYKAAEEFAFSGKTESPDFYDAINDFYYGAKWADKTMIDKACDWIKENIDIYAEVVINTKSSYPEIVMCSTFEKNFKKAMEL